MHRLAMILAVVAVAYAAVQLSDICKTENDLEKCAKNHTCATEAHLNCIKACQFWESDCTYDAEAAGVTLECAIEAMKNCTKKCGTQSVKTAYTNCMLSNCSTELRENAKAYRG